MTPTARPASRVLLVLLSLLLIGAGAAPATADEAPETLTFGIGPADRAARDAGRALFDFGLTPGSVAYDRAAVLNYAPRPQTFEVYAADAVGAADGSVSLADDQGPASDVGSWIDLAGRTRVTVPARSAAGAPGRLVIPFSLSVPADAEPGDHVGAVVVALTAEGGSGDGPSVDLVQRVAARAYVRVAGATTPGLSVVRLDARWSAPLLPWQSGHVDVDYAVVNTGNTRMGVTPSLRLRGLLTSRTLELPASTELLPRSELTGTTRLEGVWPSGPVTVELVATPRPAVLAPAPDIGPVSRGTEVWTYAWWVLVVLVLVLVLGALLVRAIRRRSRDGARPTSGRHAADTESFFDRLVDSR